MRPNSSQPEGHGQGSAQPEGAALSVGHFSNHETPTSERAEQWRNRMSGMCDFSVPSLSGKDDYLIEARQWAVSGMLLVWGHYPQMQMVRDRHHIRRDQLDLYMVSMRRSGPMKVGAGATTSSTKAMQPAIVDMAQPSTFDWTFGEGLTLFVQRDALDQLLPRPLDLHGAIPQGIGSSLLAEHLVSLDRHLPEMSSSSAPGIMSATLHMLMASLAPSVNSLGLARPVIDLNLTRLARRFIEQRLLDPELSVDLLCRQFHVSRSTLYRLFEPLGGVASYVRERRLTRAHTFLSKSGQRRYIEQIANDHGFNSASQFSRAFREQFGYSPREAAGHSLTQEARLPTEGSRQTGVRENLESLAR
jgi:AraC-like DNA-binding protein